MFMLVYANAYIYLFFLSNWKNTHRLAYANQKGEKMKEKIKKFTSYAGVVPAAVVAVCAGVSICTYTAPEYTVPKYDKISAEKVDSEKKTSKKTEVKAKKEENIPAIKNISENTTYKDGVYIGTGTGYGGELKVQVTIKDGKIAEIKLLSSNDDTPYITKAQALLKNIISGQTTNVDTVSGATYSSYGILDAVSDALSKSYSKAVEEQGKTTAPATSVTTTTTTKISEATALPSIETSENEKLINGIFAGSALCSPDEAQDFEEYELSVKLTFENGIITNISEIAGVGDDYDTSNDWYVDRAANGTSRKKGVVSQILNKQKADDIDTVSGATCSSDAIIKAVKNALETAEKSIEK